MTDQEKSKDQLIQELQECRQRNEFLHAILDGAPDMIQVMGVDGSTKYTSKAIEKLFGYTVEEALSVKVGDLYPPEDMANLGKIVSKLYNSPVGSSAQFKHRVRHKEGHWVFLETHQSNQLEPPLNATVAVCRDITHRADMLEGWQGLEESLQTIYNSVNEAIIVHDRGGKIAQINEKALTLFGVKRVAGSFTVSADQYYGPIDQSQSFEQIWDSVLDGEDKQFEWLISDQDKSRSFHADVFLTKIQLKAEDHVLAVIQDITDKKERELQLKKSLQEKEALLRETHHRVKNNFGTMVSLLRLQAKRIANKNLLDLIKETEFRIRCMGNVHEKLHQSESLSDLKIRDYIESLLKNLIDSYRASEQRISVETNISEVRLTPKQAIPLGFITSELVSNAFKHAFPRRADGNIKVELQRKDQNYLELRVSDNGSGMPSDIELDNLDSLGLMLVRNFVSQLDGTYTIENGTGVTWTIRFAAPEIVAGVD